MAVTWRKSSPTGPHCPKKLGRVKIALVENDSIKGF
jgi:hypothetical protein